MNENMTRQSGRRPAARDGHSVSLIDGQMVIFGGDRHHMPFNDMFILDLEAEYQH